MIKRYEPKEYYISPDFGYCSEMMECNDGDWVRYEDHLSKIEECAKLADTVSKYITANCSPVEACEMIAKAIRSIK